MLVIGYVFKKLFFQFSFGMLVAQKLHKFSFNFFDKRYLHSSSKD